MKLKNLVIVLTLAFAMPLVAFAQHHQRPPRPGERYPGGNDPNEERIRQLERAMADVQYRLTELERGGRIPDRGRNRITGYYCIAQCQNASYTQAGGRGISQAEAKMAAFDAVRKNWSCSLEIVECSEEYGP